MNEVPEAGQAALASELLTYRLKLTELKVLLESKQQMAARGVASPDGADALALTFAQTIDPGAPTAAHVAPVARSVVSELTGRPITSTVAPIRM